MVNPHVKREPSSTPAPSVAPVDRRFLLGGLAGVAGAATLAGLAKGGPLTPPAGGVSSTGKPIGELEPRRAVNSANIPASATGLFRISQPGSYYLTANIDGVAGRNGVEIASDNVTLDLNGFAVRGTGIGNGTLSGVTTAGQSLLENIVVRNGIVSGWGGNGVTLSGGGGTGVGGVIEDVTVIGNGARGIHANGAAVVRRCTARLNVIAGIALPSGGIVDSCVSQDNLGPGYELSVNIHAVGCVAAGNGDFGFSVQGSSLMESCVARQNDSGGIDAGSGSRVTGCTVSGNGEAGISVTSGCAVVGNTVTANTLFGITTLNDCLIEGNQLDGHATACLRISGVDNRIHGNHCTDSGEGVSVTGTGNIITGNTCSGNGTNYFIDANNYYGAIVNRTGVLTASVNGSSATGTLATADPHANFSF
ncbi:MAG TPA: hypothetical protein VEB22_12080 [Phycisphaerales bacterium]|nr:hypothetical protein [Phycisphaerales bacterium]